MIESFSTIDTSEVVALTFDFAAGIPADETIVSASIVVSVISGVDGSPQSFLKQYAISGTSVVATVGTGVDGVTYKIKVAATNANRTLALTGKIRVRAE